MPVVINDFEVVPAPANENRTPDKKPDEKGSPKPPMSDYDVKRTLERQIERLERILAH
jgi:hypothetical protein